MKSIATALVAAAALAASFGATSAHAQDSGFKLSGFHVGGSVGSSDNKVDAIGGYDTKRSDTGLKVYGGYDFTPNLGVELGYVNLGRARSDAGTVKSDGYYLDGVGKLPVADKLSVLGRVGVFNGHQRDRLRGNDSGTNLKIGAGLQYDLTPKVAIRGEVERYRFDTYGGKSNANLYSVGVNYAF